MDLTQEQKFKFRYRLEQEQAAATSGQSASTLQDWADTITKTMAPVAKAQSVIERTMPLAIGAVNPPMGMAVKAGQDAMKGIFQGFDVAGEKATEALASRNMVSPEAAAAIGTGIQMIPPVASAFLPMPGGPEPRIFKPNVPAGRLPAVAAAEEMGVPLTRAEMTGGKSSSLLESGLAKSLTGSETIQKFRQAQAQAIENALSSLKKRFGTEEPLSAAGAEAKMSMQSELGQAKSLGKQLYKDIPDVPIPAENLSKSLEDAIAAQVHLTDPKVASVVSKIEQTLGRTPQATEATSPKPIGEPAGSQYRVGPTTQAPPPPPTFQKINELRNYLSAEIQKETTYDPIRGNQVSPTGAKLSGLKQALDKDIQQYTTTQTEPLQQMEAGQFKTAFTKANAFHGARKSLERNLLVKKLSRVPESDMAKTIFGPGRKEDILVAKAALGEPGFQVLKKQFFNDIIESKNIGRTIDRYEPEFLSHVFNGKELDALRKIDQIKQTALGAEKIAGNPSGTAQNVMTAATVMDLIRLGLKLPTAPLQAIAEATGILAGPFAGSKAYLGSAKGLRVPVNAAMRGAARGGAMTQGLNVLEKDPKIRETLMNLLSKLKQKAA